jgi:hypothetical protein
MSLVAALLCAGAVQAGDYEDGLTAYNRQDYRTALTKFRSAAQHGSISEKFFVSSCDK